MKYLRITRDGKLDKKEMAEQYAQYAAEAIGLKWK